MRARHSWATPWIIGLAAFVLVCCLSAATTAQPTTQPQPQAEEEQLPEPAPTPEAKPLRGPKYLNLRYDEDFSYLDGPEDSYEADFFDPIKRIHLSDDLTLSLGGSFRARHLVPYEPRPLFVAPRRVLEEGSPRLRRR